MPGLDKSVQHSDLRNSYWKSALIGLVVAALLGLLIHTEFDIEFDDGILDSSQNVDEDNREQMIDEPEENSNVLAGIDLDLDPDNDKTFAIEFEKRKEQFHSTITDELGPAMSRDILSSNSFVFLYLLRHTTTSFGPEGPDFELQNVLTSFMEEFESSDEVFMIILPSKAEAANSAWAFEIAGRIYSWMALRSSQMKSEGQVPANHRFPRVFVPVKVLSSDLSSDYSEIVSFLIQQSYVDAILCMHEAADAFRECINDLPTEMSRTIPILVPYTHSAFSKELYPQNLFPVNTDSGDAVTKLRIGLRQVVVASREGFMASLLYVHSKSGGRLQSNPSKHSNQRVRVEDRSVLLISTIPEQECGVGVFNENLRKGLIAAGARVKVVPLKWEERFPSDSKLGFDLVWDLDLMRKGAGENVFFVSEFVDKLLGLRQASEVDFDFDIIVLHHEYGMYPNLGSELALLAKELKMKMKVNCSVLCIAHTLYGDVDIGSMSPNKRKILPEISKWVDNVIVLSGTALKRASLNLNLDLNSMAVNVEKKVKLIPHGIVEYSKDEITQFATAYRRENPFLHGKRFILTIGNVHEKKWNITEVIKAFAEIEGESTYRDVLYLICGRFHEVMKKIVSQMVHDFDLKDRVVLVDKYLAPAEYFGAIAACEAVILPYSDYTSNSGVIHDVLAMRKPFIVPFEFEFGSEILTERWVLPNMKAESWSTRLHMILGYRSHEMQEDIVKSYTDNDNAILQNSWASFAHSLVQLTSPSIKILFEGPLFSNEGFASVDRSIVSRLIADSAGFDVQLRSRYEWDAQTIKGDPGIDRLKEYEVVNLNEQPFDVVIRSGWIDDGSKLWESPDVSGVRSRKWIQIQPWEFDIIPDEWIEILKRDDDHIHEHKHRTPDEIWVPSAHAAQGFISADVSSEVVVVRNGAEPPRNLPQRARRHQHEDTFTFLYVGTLLERKGIDILLDAFEIAFPNSNSNPPPNVRLVIREGVPSCSVFARQIRERVRSMDRVSFYRHDQRSLPEKEMSELYWSSDCLVHPFRAEGFGLPVFEAIAHGLSVIATKAPPITEYFNDGDSDAAGGRMYWVEADRSPLPADLATNLKLKPNHGHWFEPKVDELVAEMRRCHLDVHDENENGDISSFHMTWEEPYHQMRKRIIEMATGKYR